MSDSPLVGRGAIVTGAGSGIGAAMAEALAARGADVAVVDLDLERARAVATGTDAPGTLIAIEADVSAPEEVAAVFDQTVARFGRVDLLVNNAALIEPVATIDSIPLDRWRRLFAVNVEGPLLTTQAAVAQMRTQPPSSSGCRGRIVNVSSPAAIDGATEVTAYGASKAALNYLTRATAAAFGDDGIATTALYPGHTTGAMWPGLAHLLAGVAGTEPETVMAARMAELPVGRFLTPEEIAAALAYIACADGMSLNGKVVWSHAHVGAL